MRLGLVMVWIVMLAAVLAGGLLGLHTLAGRQAHGPATDIEWARRRIQQLQELTVLRVPVAFVHEATFNGRLGGIRCLLEVHGWVDMGVDLAEARLTDVDASCRTATLQLPEVHVVTTKVDMQATRIYTIDRWGLWLLVPGEAGAQQVLRQALEDSESLVGRPGTDASHLRQAQLRAKAVCEELMDQIGWTLR